MLADTSAAERSSLLAAVVTGLTVAAVLGEGAFHAAEALLVGVASLVLVVIQLRTKPSPASRPVALAIGLLALCWFLESVAHRTPEAFLPLGASMLGFVAAYLTLDRLNVQSRQTSARVLVLLGTLTSLLGLIALALRWYPLAIRVGQPWRLSSTLTYYNAEALLLAMVLVIAIGLDQELWSIRAAIAICTAGLLATQSRGVLLALVLGILFVPAAQLRRAALPLLAGLLAGLLIVAISDHNRMPILLLVPVIGCAIASIAVDEHRQRPKRRIDPIRAVVGFLVVGLMAVGIWFLIHPAVARLHTASNGERLAIWKSAFDQWRSSPVIGAGPDHLLHVHYVGIFGSEANFAHNEYLQILADSGLVGATLLAVAAAFLIRSIRRVNLMTSCATGALVVFAVAGVFDFDWHLPALGLIGGWVAGLAGRGKE